MTSELDRLIRPRRRHVDDDGRPARRGRYRLAGEDLPLLDRQVEGLSEVQIDAERRRLLPQQELDHACEGVEVDAVAAVERRHRAVNDATRNRLHG
jgi:hypothetical protein